MTLMLMDADANADKAAKRESDHRSLRSFPSFVVTEVNKKKIWLAIAFRAHFSNSMCCYGANNSGALCCYFRQSATSESSSSILRCGEARLWRSLAPMRRRVHNSLYAVNYADIM